jgi:hypothetical protein
MLPRIHRLPVQVLPIVQSGSLDLLFVYAKACGSDDPELGIERHARAPNISRVLRDLWLKQYDV